MSIKKMDKLFSFLFFVFLTLSHPLSALADGPGGGSGGGGFTQECEGAAGIGNG